jgi:hypothetical protein
MNEHFLAAARGISQPPLVAAVYPPRHHAAAWAGRLAGAGPGQHTNRPARSIEMLDGQTSQVRNKDAESLKMHARHDHKHDDQDATGHAGQITSPKVSQGHRNLTIDSANTDLVERFTPGLPLTEADPATFYTGGAKGLCRLQDVDQMTGELKTCQR